MMGASGDVYRTYFCLRSFFYKTFVWKQSLKGMYWLDILLQIFSLKDILLQIINVPLCICSPNFCIKPCTATITDIIHYKFHEENMLLNTLKYWADKCINVGNRYVSSTKRNGRHFKTIITVLLVMATK